MIAKMLTEHIADAKNFFDDYGAQVGNLFLKNRRQHD
jgi:hypothetical protein